MFRIVMIVLMFSICTFIGFFIGERYRARSMALKEIQKALMLLNSEIMYATTPLPDALMSIGKKISQPTSNMFIKMASDLEGGYCNGVYEVFEDSYKELKESININHDDYKLLSDFFKSLGSSGITGQDKIFNLALENIDMNYKEARNLEKTNIKLYRTLGLATGAMLAIFFI